MKIFPVNATLPNDEHCANCTLYRYHQDDRLVLFTQNKILKLICYGLSLGLLFSLWYLYLGIHAAIIKIFPIFFVGIFNVMIARHLRTISKRRALLSNQLKKGNLRYALRSMALTWGGSSSIACFAKFFEKSIENKSRRLSFFTTKPFKFEATGFQFLERTQKVL